MTITLAMCVSLLSTGCLNPGSQEIRHEYHLGARSLPGHDIEVTQTGKAFAGQVVTFTVKATSTSDRRIQSVAVRIGDKYQESVETVLAQPGENATYTADLMVPTHTESSENRLWVMVLQDDGAVLEGGPDDFALER